MQKLGILVEGVLRYRSEDEQAILLEGITFDEFTTLDDQLNSIVQIDLPLIFHPPVDPFQYVLAWDEQTDDVYLQWDNDSQPDYISWDV